MHRIAVELPIVAIVATAMAGMVLVAGNAIELPTEPIVLSSRPVESRSHDAVGCLEAPLTGDSVSGAAGHARLCHDGRDLQIGLRVDGVAPGDVFTAWLGYRQQLAPCDHSPCESIDLSSERSTGLMHQTVRGADPASRVAELDTSVREVQLPRGAQLSLVLLRPGGHVVPHAQATFIVP